MLFVDIVAHVSATPFQRNLGGLHRLESSSAHFAKSRAAWPCFSASSITKRTDRRIPDPSKMELDESWSSEVRAASP